MKYIKTYENNAKFEVGDYVLCNLTFKYPAKIINIDKEYIHMPYYVNIFKGSNFKKTWIGKNKIIRKLTSQEIEDFETELKTIKFNL